METKTTAAAVQIGADMTVRQIMTALANGQTAIDTVLEHFCSCRYDVDAFTDDDIEVLGMAEFRRIMKCQTTLQVKTAVAAVAPKGGKGKTQCLVETADFVALAEALEIALSGCGGGVVYTPKPKLFNSGSMGWTVNQKSSFKVGDVTQLCQIGINVTLIGSKAKRIAEGWVPLTKEQLKAAKAAAKAAGLETDDDDDDSDV